MEVLCGAADFAVIIREPWGVARKTFAPASSSSFCLVTPDQQVGSLTLTRAVKKHTAQYARSGRLHIHLSKKLKQKRSFDKLGPMQKIAQLEKSQLLPSAIERFCGDDARTNLLKQVRGSLPGLTSAFRFYTAFCELRNFTPFPPTEDKAVQRSCVFNNTATFGNYIPYMQKCCFFLNMSTDWFTPKVRHVAMGLKKSQNRSFRFSNFIRRSLLIQLLRRATVQSEFAKASFLSFLFALRVPSENLQLRMAYRGDQLLAFSPQPEKAPVGTSAVGGETFLVTKFSWWENMVGGCILRRPCFCSLGRRHATSLFPIHIFWAEIRRRVQPGQLLSRSVNRGNFNRMLKAVFAHLHIPDAGRYSSHGFRRGAAQELKESGPPGRWWLLPGCGIPHLFGVP